MNSPSDNLLKRLIGEIQRRSLWLWIATQLVGLSSLGLTPARAQTARIIVGENVLVSSAESIDPHVEPHIAAHPDDPMHLVAATMRFPPAVEQTSTNCGMSMASSWNNLSHSFTSCFVPQRWLLRPAGSFSQSLKVSNCGCRLMKG